MKQWYYALLGSGATPPFKKFSLHSPAKLWNNNLSKHHRRRFRLHRILPLLRNVNAQRSINCHELRVGHRTIVRIANNQLKTKERAFSFFWWWRLRRGSISSSSAEFSQFERCYDVANDSVEWRGHYGVEWRSFGSTQRWNRIRRWWCFDELLFLDLAGEWTLNFFKAGVAPLRSKG